MICSPALNANNKYFKFFVLGEGPSRTGMVSQHVVSVGMDITLFGACCVSMMMYYAHVALPFRSYGGRMPQSTYLVPCVSTVLYKLLYWCIGVDGALPTHFGVALLGAFVCALALACDREQCGPGIFVAFVGGCVSSFAVALFSGMVIHVIDPKTALLITEAGVPVAIGVWVALGRQMHSD